MLLIFDSVCVFKQFIPEGGAASFFLINVIYMRKHFIFH